MTVLLKAIYRFSAIHFKLPTAFFTEPEQEISQFVRKYKRPWIAEANLRKKNETGGINLPDSDYTTKLKSLRQYGTFTKAEI